MIIQCTACETKYRLNLSKVPAGRAFVKCRKCGTPVYISGQAEPQEQIPPVLPPDPGWDGGGSAAAEAPSGYSEPPGSKHPVTCPRCGSRYRVAGEILANPKTQLKCTRCDHLFRPGLEGVAGTGRVIPPGVPQGMPSMPGGGDMPLPDESRLNVMFDDLREDQPPPMANRPRAAQPAAAAKPAKSSKPTSPRFEPGGDLNPESAYLEAISLGGEEPAPEGYSSGLAPVPDSQKYKFFLKPGTPPPAAGGKAERPFAEHFAAAQAAQPAPTRTPQDRPGPNWETLASQSSPSHETEGLDDPDHHGWDDAELPHPEHFAGLSGQVSSHTRPGQGAPGGSPQASQVSPEAAVAALTGSAPRVVRQPLWPVWLAAVVLLTGGLGWGAKMYLAPPLPHPQLMVGGGELPLQFTGEPRQHLVKNSETGRNLLVLSGDLRLQAASKKPVGWVEVRVIALRDGLVVGEGRAYAGNVLPDEDIKRFTLRAIRASAGYRNGQRDINVSIPPGGSIPYQVILDGITTPVDRVETQVLGYLQDGRQVYPNP
ncbi:MAG: zinc-ribbon domain-containing protein [Deltaproteobacteria bacterium]|nr:zinc-ribbon domain-containing protein [Deltaproteobacteria bacterium]